MALGYMRRHRRWLYAFLWIVILGFIVFYIPAFQNADSGSPAETLGRVGDLPITVGEFQRAYLERRQFYEQMYQGRLDPAMLQNLGLEEQVFETLVAERLMRLEAERLGLRVDDQSLARRLASSPQFQRDGRFVGASEIRRLLELRGLTVEQFEDDLRNGLLREKLQALVTDGVGVTPAELEREFRRRTEQVRLEYVLVAAERFRAAAAAADGEVKARFDAQRESYRVPEKRVLSYLLLDAEALGARVTVTDRDLEAYYRERSEEFRQPEEVCASHVLVKVKETEQAGEGHADAEAKRLADSFLQKLRAGADFAELARQVSEDLGSKPNGGDLGCFGRGRMVPEFENAAFATEPGQISEPVKSSFGYHIVQVRSRREESVPPLAQVKERIRQRLLGQRVRALVEEKVDLISQALARGRGLVEVAKQQGFAVEKSAPLARGENAGPLASPALLARGFALKPGELAREPFQLPRGYAFIALAEVQPSRLPELAEVQERVRTDLANQRARALALALARELRAGAQKAGLQKAAVENGLLRKETPALVGRGQALGELGTGAALEQAAFALPEQTLSEPVRVASGWALIRVLERKAFDAEAFARQRESIRESLVDQKRGSLFEAFLREARGRHAVERRADAMRRITG